MNINIERIFMCHVGVDHDITIQTRVASPIIGGQGESPPITGKFDFVPVYEEFSGDKYPECGLFKSYKELKLRTTDIRDVVRSLVEDQLLVFESVWKSLDKSIQDKLLNLLPIEIPLLINNDVNRLVEFYLSACVHYDPEFEHFTYGDYPHRTRASLLLKRSISRGDLLFFNSRLQLWDIDAKKFCIKKKPKNVSREQFIHERVNKSLEYRRRLIEETIKILEDASKSEKQGDESEQRDEEICLRAALYSPDILFKCQKKYLPECRKQPCVDTSLYVYDWYVIGFFQIEDIVKLNGVSFNYIAKDERLKLNPHYQRCVDAIESRQSDLDDAWIFIGSAKRSLYFKEAVIISNDLWKKLSEYVTNPYRCTRNKYKGLRNCVETKGDRVETEGNCVEMEDKGVKILSKYECLRGCVEIRGKGVKIFLDYIKAHVPEFQSIGF